MEEPSVLDYVKEKLTFWKKGQIQIPDGEEQPEDQPPQPALERERSKFGFWPLLSIAVPPFLAIFAQLFAAPEVRSKGLVIFFYCLAALSLVLLIIFKLWKTDSLNPGEGEADQLKVRWVQLLVGSLFSLLAFVMFAGNRFNSVNVSFWVLGLALIWWSLWVPEQWWLQIRSAWKRFLDGELRITPWTVLVFLAFLVVGFYRFYRLNQVPPEMFSDHAEKLIDVSNVLRGQYAIFFPRNTGREAFQMYLTAAMARLFGTGISFLSLKLGTCLVSYLSLPFIYLLGKEIKNKQVGLLAMFFAGIAYWPNVISRVALRFALYPAFLAPTLFFLIRGLKRKRWNDFLFAGLFLGIGLHGYSPFRIVPIAVILLLAIYLLHASSKENRRMAVIALVLVGLISLIIFLPLGRYALDNYDMFSYRMRTRMSDAESPLPGNPWSIFFSNTWKALIMFQWDNGQIWVHSIPGRPALELISASFFSLGVVLIAVRYLKKRHWMDLTLLVIIPVLMLPSILSLAFPSENPSLNRSGGAIIPVFLIVGIAVENLAVNLKSYLSRSWAKYLTWGVVLLLVGVSMRENARLVFVDYYQQFRRNAWNTSEIGAVIHEFAGTIGDETSAWVVPYPHWVDTRLVGIQAVGQVRDYALWPDEIETTFGAPAPKLYIYKPDDQEAIGVLEDLYPDGVLDSYHSAVEGRDFMLYYVLNDESEK